MIVKKTPTNLKWAAKIQQIHSLGQMAMILSNKFNCLHCIRFAGINRQMHFISIEKAFSDRKINQTKSNDQFQYSHSTRNGKWNRSFVGRNGVHASAVRLMQHNVSEDYASSTCMSKMVQQSFDFDTAPCQSIQWPWVRWSCPENSYTYERMLSIWLRQRIR